MPNLGGSDSTQPTLSCTRSHASCLGATIFLLPLDSWYDSDFDTDPELPTTELIPYPPGFRWTDYHSCKVREVSGGMLWTHGVAAAGVADSARATTVLRDLDKATNTHAVAGLFFPRPKFFLRRFRHLQFHIRVFCETERGLCAGNSKTNVHARKECTHRHAHPCSHRDICKGASQVNHPPTHTCT